MIFFLTKWKSMDWSIIKCGVYRPTCVIYTNTIDYCFCHPGEKAYWHAAEPNNYFAKSINIYSNNFDKDVQGGN